MFWAGLLAGSIISLILYGILNAGAVADDDAKIAMWRRKYKNAEKEIERLNKFINKLEDKLKLAELRMIGGYSDGKKEQKERVSSGERTNK
jgi:peptidoglycan hydrolase CwlO-like protein